MVSVIKTPKMQLIHDVQRYSLLQFVGMDFIIFDSVGKMRGLPRNSNSVTVGTTLDQIMIENPYFIPQSPIFAVPQAMGPSTIETRFNKGELSWNLYQLVIGFGADDDKLLEYIRIYIDYTLAIFLQKLISYVLLYPERMLYLKSLDNKQKLDILKDKASHFPFENYGYESGFIFNTVLILIDAIGNKLNSETSLLPLLTEIDESDQNNWNLLVPAQFDSERIQNLTELTETFRTLLHSMKPDLISGIPLSKINNIVNNPPDLVRLCFDNRALEIIAHIWQDLFEPANNPPMVFLFFKNEIVKIFEYFSKSKPVSVAELLGISLDRIKKFLDTIIGENLESNLAFITSRPSSELVLNLFRSLKSDINNNRPNPATLSMLYSFWWLLQSTPLLYQFHERAEQFIESWTVLPGNVKKYNSGRLDPINLCQQIFPSIVNKSIGDVLSEAPSFEIIYNKNKEQSMEFVRRASIPGGLTKILSEMRGVPL
jgi:hypothetical protein